VAEPVTTINDFVLLGRAVPVDLREGARNSVCAAGYSRQIGGLVRVFPTRGDHLWHRWDIARVRVRRDRKDSRPESWHLAHDWDASLADIEVLGQVPEERRMSLLTELVSDCVLDLNDKREGLGIVKPVRPVLKAYHIENPQYGEPIQKAVGFARQAVVDVRKQYRWQPRLRYRCEGCHATKYHDQQVLEWGFYLWQRKQPSDPDQVWRNAHIYDEEYEIFLLVGNQRDQRTSYLVISIIRVRKTLTPHDLQQELL